MTTTTTTTPPAKRPYVRPALIIHGDVQTITQTAGLQHAAVVSFLPNP